MTALILSVFVVNFNIVQIYALSPCAAGISNEVCNEISVCEDNGVFFPLDLANTYDDFEEQIQYLNDEYNLGCDYTSDPGEGYVGNSDSGDGYRLCGNDGDIANAVMHALFTALLAYNSHSDTLGCGTPCARNKALKFMQAREECLSTDNAFMDMHNNIVGADIFAQHVTVECSLRIGYIFGNVCLIQKEVPATPRELALMVMMLATDAVKLNRANLPPSNMLTYVKCQNEGNTNSGQALEFRICFQETEGSSQCQGSRLGCSDWSLSEWIDDMWSPGFRDDTDNRGGGCKYQWKLEQRVINNDYTNYLYRVCFRENEGSSQCQGVRNSCSGWNNAPWWNAPFIDDTDSRSGGCKYQWSIEQKEHECASPINGCRVCFKESAGTSQCQQNRNTCSKWSDETLNDYWTLPFRDDTDNRGGGCDYQWKIECH